MVFTLTQAATKLLHGSVSLRSGPEGSRPQELIASLRTAAMGMHVAVQAAADGEYTGPKARGAAVRGAVLGATKVMRTALADLKQQVAGLKQVREEVASTVREREQYIPLVQIIRAQARAGLLEAAASEHKVDPMAAISDAAARGDMHELVAWSFTPEYGPLAEKAIAQVSAPERFAQIQNLGPSLDAARDRIPQIEAAIAELENADPDAILATKRPDPVHVLEDYLADEARPKQQPSPSGDEIAERLHA